MIEHNAILKQSLKLFLQHLKRIY